MWHRRIVYLVILLAAYIFFLLYRMWLAWYLLLLVLSIPVIALLLLIINYVTFVPTIKLPNAVYLGDTYTLKMGNCNKSANDYHLLTNYNAAITVLDECTGKKSKIKYKSTDNLTGTIQAEASHCGAYIYRLKTVWIHDPIGLFTMPKKTDCTHLLFVRPTPIVPAKMPSTEIMFATNLQKAKSQFAEIYDIRDYIPGDAIKNIHWKMSAKKDSILIREPLEENIQRTELIVQLTSSRDDMDQILGETLFVSTYYLDKGLHHQIKVMSSSDGERVFDIFTQDDIENTIDQILRMSLPENNPSEVIARKEKTYE